MQFVPPLQYITIPAIRNNWNSTSSCSRSNGHNICNRLSFWRSVNPAVTIGLWAAGKLRPKEAALYIISQIIEL